MRQLYIAQIYRPRFIVKKGNVCKMIWESSSSDTFFLQVENMGDEREAIKRHLKNLSLDPVTEKIISKMSNGKRFKIHMTKIAPHMQVTPIERHIWGTHPKTRILYF